MPDFSLSFPRRFPESMSGESGMAGRSGADVVVSYGASGGWASGAWGMEACPKSMFRISSGSISGDRSVAMSFLPFCRYLRPFFVGFLGVKIGSTDPSF